MSLGLLCAARPHDYLCPSSDVFLTVAVGLTSDFFSRLRERWHIDRKTAIFIFQSDTPYNDLETW